MHGNWANLEQGKKKHIHIKTLEIKKTLSWTHGAKAQMDVRVRVLPHHRPRTKETPPTPLKSQTLRLFPRTLSYNVTNGGSHEGKGMHT